MKKLLYSIAGCSLLLLGACASSKKASIQDIAGEWIIENVNGTAVTTSEMQDTAFLGFDVATGSLYGNAGCNSILGSFNPQSDPEVLVLENTGSTRMMCPDMTTEDMVLPALSEVKAYHFSKKGNLELLDANGKVVFTLEKRTK